jgi:ferredoxin
MSDAATFHVRLLPSGLRFDAPAGSSVLAAAEAAGIALPNSCRNGTCRTCLCQIVSGSVRYLIDWPGVTREERAAGAVLPCVALATSELTLTATAKRAPAP